MDLDVSAVIEGEQTLTEAGSSIHSEILEAASGKLSKAEVSGYSKAMNFYTIGPVI